MADKSLLDEEDLAKSDDVDFVEEHDRLAVLRGRNRESFRQSERDRFATNSYECQPPVERLERYIADHNLNNKRTVAQAVVDTMRIVSRESPQDVAKVLEIFSRLAYDSDVQMRTDMMLQVPQIALLCYEVADQLSGVVEEHLLPLIIKSLTDTEESLRKTAHTALVMLMEQNLITREAIEVQVCPVVLMNMDTMPNHLPSAVILMSNIAPLVGREKAMELFLDHFVDLCYVADSFVRTVCAARFAGFCKVMGRNITETVLLTCYVELCKDSASGVRMECANVFLAMSCMVSLTTRRQVLAPILIEFLRDKSRWVKMPAYRSLGPFIWTLAQEQIGNPYSRSPPIKPNTHPQDKYSHLSNITCAVEVCENKFAKSMVSFNEDPCCAYFSKDDYCEDSFCGSTASFDRDDASLEEPSSKEMSSVPDDAIAEVSGPENDYNAFLYWRLPLPDVDPDLGIGDVAEPKSNSNSSVLTPEVESTHETPSMAAGDQQIPSQCTEDSSAVDREKMEVSWSSSRVNGFSNRKDSMNENKDRPLNTMEEKEDGSCKKESAEVLGDDEDRVLFFDGRRIGVRHRQGTSSSPYGTLRCTSDGWAQTRKVPAVPTASLEQDIVPQALIDHYVSMSTPLIIDEEAELSHFCAFNFPAVTLTLGRENWPLLSGAYEVLAANMQWKVRHALASSIHELAVILGEELAAQYLVPVFIGFLKDVDEVRVGFVKHLAEFLKLIGPNGRSKCLPSLLGLFTSGDDLKWRFRAELTRQLMKVTNQFTPKDVLNHLSNIGLALVLSPVAALRQNALLLLAEHIRYLSIDKMLLESLLQRLAKDLAQSEDWVQRQCYALLCELLFVPQSHKDSMRDWDEDEEEECNEHTYGNVINNEDDKQDDKEWRNRIAPLLAQYVFPYLLSLSSDRIPNVRIAVARVMRVVQLTPTEQSYLQPYIIDESGTSDGGDIRKVPSFETALERLQNDDDPDVQYFAIHHQLSCSSETSGHQFSCPTIEDTIG